MNLKFKIFKICLGLKIKFLCCLLLLKITYFSLKQLITGVLILYSKNKWIKAIKL